MGYMSELFIQTYEQLRARIKASIRFEEQEEYEYLKNQTLMITEIINKYDQVQIFY